MKKRKRSDLRAAGWKVGSAAEFLGLTPDEAALVEIKVSLAAYLRQVRTRQRLTQEEAARRLRSSQSRVAKMEAADPSVSLDRLVRSLLALGASTKDVARAVARAA